MHTVCRCLAARWRWRLGQSGKVRVQSSKLRVKKAGPTPSMHPAIVVIRAAARVHIELLPHAVDLPFQVAVLHFRKWVETGAGEEEIGNEQAAKMRRVR